MRGLPDNIDLSFFVGKTLESVTFGYYVIHFLFSDSVSITLESSYQQQEAGEAEQGKLALWRKLPVSESKLMQLIKHSVVSATGSMDGTMVLKFDDGQVLTLFDSSAPQFESYQFTDGEHHWVV